MIRLLSISLAVGILALGRADASGAAGDAEGPSGRWRADQAALKDFGDLVGRWRGVGQPRRGRARGSWTESATWAWALARDSAALGVEFDEGKYLKSGRLRPGPEPGSFRFEAELADGSSRRFQGRRDPRGRLVLTAEGAGGEGVRRVTIRPLHETRLIVVLEARDPESGVFYPLGELGYTREGVRFAAGESYPACVVTEGRGTSQVSYRGRTYWVCCSGCRDLFLEDPEAILAEAANRLEGRPETPGD